MQARRRYVRATGRRNIPEEEIVETIRQTMDIVRDQLDVRRRLAEARAREDQIKLRLSEDNEGRRIALRGVQGTIRRLERLQENLNQEEERAIALPADLAAALIPRPQQPVVEEVRLEDLYRARDEDEIEEEEKKEEEATEDEDVEIMVLQNAVIDRINLIDLEVESNADMQFFLDRFGDFLRSPSYRGNIDELRTMVEFLTGREEYEILRFFAVTYRGIVLNPGEQRLGRGRGRVAFNAWKRNVIAGVRAYYPDHARDLEHANVSRAARGTDKLLYRFNSEQVDYAMTATIDITTRGSALANPNFNVAGYQAAANELFVSVHMGQDFQNPNMFIPAASVAIIWTAFFNVLRTMRAVWANGLTMPSVILYGSHYRRETINGEQVQLLQAFPFLMTKQRGYGYANGGKELMVSDMMHKIRWMINTAQVKDLLLKVRVKMLLTAAADEGTDPLERPQTQEKFITIEMDPITLKRTPPEAEEFRSIMDRANDDFRSVLEDLAAATPEEIEEWFFRNLLNNMQRLQDKYHDMEVLDGTEQVDLESILIDYINVIGIEPLVPGLPMRRGPAITNAFCKTASQGVVRKMAMFSECTSLGICIYEALWTLKHLMQIRGREKKDGLSYWGREDREKLMLADFVGECDQVKLMALHGNVPLLMITFGQMIPIVIWESEEAVGFIDQLQNMDACLVVFDCHVFCANAKKVREELKKRLLAAKKKEEDEKEEENDPTKSKYILRPRYTREEMNRIRFKEWEEKMRKNPESKCPPPEDLDDTDDTINYFLDIETSINKKTGVFTPYLICVLNRYETFTWWGEDCKLDFMEWMRSIIDEREGVEVSHNHKTKKIVIWTFNGDKFDLVFLVKQLLTLPKVQFKGAENNLKGLEICNVKFRDFNKVSTVGPLKDQAIFYNTELKKTEVDHEEITDEFIAWINEEEEKCLDAQLKKLEIIEYCINDCKVLMQCFEKFSDWVRTNLDISPYVCSAAGLALSYWLTHHNPAKIKDSRKINMDKAIKGVPKWLYPIVKQSYKGGIVVVFMKTIPPGSKWEQADINSCYSKEMWQRYYPTCFIGEVKYSSFRHITRIAPSTITDWFLYQVNDLQWKKDTIFPTIPKKTEQGLNHTLKHSCIDYVWGVELKFAMSTGQIESGTLSREFQFKADRVFRSYVEELYMKRRRQCKATGDKMGDKFYKILLNSLYGKFGQKLYPQKVVCNAEKLVYYADVIQGVPEEVCDDIWLATLNDDDYDNQIGGCIPMASYTTACARVGMLSPVKTITRNFTIPGLWAYSDTDSIVVKKGSTPQHFLSKTELGKWDIEKDNITEWYAPAKKMYYMKYGSEGKDVMKSKGITPRYMCKQDYITLCDEGVLKGKQGGDKWTRHKLGYVTKTLNKKDIKVFDSRFYYNNGMSSLPKFE